MLEQHTVHVDPPNLQEVSEKIGTDSWNSCRMGNFLPGFVNFVETGCYDNYEKIAGEMSYKYLGNSTLI